MHFFFKTIILLSILLAATVPAAAQEDGASAAQSSLNKIDSLLSLIKPSLPDSAKAKLYYEVARETANADTMFKYTKLSLDCCNDDNVDIMSRNYSLICFVYYSNGKLDSAMSVLRKNVELCERAGALSQLLKSYRNMAAIYEAKNLSDSVFYYLNRSLDICLRAKDTCQISECYYALAVFALNRQLMENAEKYGRQAVRLDSLGCNCNKKDLGTHIMLLGIVFQGMYEVDKDTSKLYKSLECLKKSVRLYDSIVCVEFSDVYQKSVVYDNISYTYVTLAKATGNKAYADSCISYYERASDFFLKNDIIDSYLNCSKTYTEYLLFQKKYKEAEKFVLSLGKHISDNTPVAYKHQYYMQLENVYEVLGDWENAFKNQKIVNQYARQHVNDSTLNVIADAKAQQAVMIEKIEREKDEQIHAAETSRMRTLIFSLIAGLLLVSLLVFYILRMLSIKRKANAELSEKNAILKSQKNEIESQRDEIAAQNDIITEQWREVESVNNKLLHSITYAERIQRAAVSSEDDVHNVFPDSFVFYRPRDIVSGDYYRCGRCGRFSVMVTADCTGHGIPGAFLSMLGLSALKEYMATESDAENPGTVLDRMRDFIKATLVTSKDGKFIDDGMDMTICCYDYNNMELRYAIANQTAFIVRGGEAIKLKGDIMPVGRYVREKDHFKSLSIPIQKGDMVYTFSDGIQDQLGGEESRKFLLKSLLELLVSIAHKPADMQCQLLEKAIIDWRGDIPQVDDMTLVGIRV